MKPRKEFDVAVWLAKWLSSEEQDMGRKSNGPSSLYTNTAHVRAFRKDRNKKALLRLLKDFAKSL